MSRGFLLIIKLKIQYDINVLLANNFDSTLRDSRGQAKSV